MIYTITLNPSIDYVIETNKFNTNQTNYYQKDYQVIGGKGINVAAVLNNLQENVMALGIMGEGNKEIFLNKFSNIKLKNNFYFHPYNSRVNFKIKNLLLQQETELNSIGPTIDEQIINNFVMNLKSLIKENDIVAVSGSVSQTVSKDIYFKIGQIINEKKAVFILDATKDLLINGLMAKPYLIKPNLEEMCEILSIPFNQEYSILEIKKMVYELQKKGAQNVLLSMGSKGSYYFSYSNQSYQINSGKGKLINSVGAGDSMVAGFVYGLSNNLDIKKTLQYASAAGSATAFTEWLALKPEIMKLVNQIKVCQIDN